MDGCSWDTPTEECIGTFEPVKCTPIGTSKCIFLLDEEPNSEENGSLEHPFTSIGENLANAIDDPEIIIYSLD